MTTLHLPPDAFVPVEAFPLYWRWSQASHALLPAAVLATIHPLTPEAARALSDQASARCPACSDIQPLVDIRARASSDEQAVRSQLLTLPVGAPDTIVVQWLPHMAVLTSWGTFVTHWDDFCYPASDDVSVWDPSADWALCYCHHEHFTFARPGTS